MMLDDSVPEDEKPTLEKIRKRRIKRVVILISQYLHLNITPIPSPANWAYFQWFSIVLMTILKVGRLGYRDGINLASIRLCLI